MNYKINVGKIKKEKQYKFCCLKTKCTIEKNIISFSKIFVVILEGNDFDKFNVSNHFCIYNNNNIIYHLVCFIEAFSNIVYYKDNNNKW